MTPCSDCGSITGRHPGRCTRRPIATRLPEDGRKPAERVAWSVRVAGEHIGDIVRVDLGGGHAHYRCVMPDGKTMAGRGRVWEYGHALNALVMLAELGGPTGWAVELEGDT